jgi:hypothetical protein
MFLQQRARFDSGWSRRFDSSWAPPERKPPLRTSPNGKHGRVVLDVHGLRKKVPSTVDHLPQVLVMKVACCWNQSGNNRRDNPSD